MKDKSHAEFTKRWAEFVRDNPDKWKKIHTKFINSQLNMSNDFLKRLSKQPGGKEKILKLRSLKI